MVLHNSLKVYSLNSLKETSYFLLKKKSSLKNKLIFSTTKIHICYSE